MYHDWCEISKFHHLRSRRVPAPVDLTEKISTAENPPKADPQKWFNRSLYFCRIWGGCNSEIPGFDREILMAATANQTSRKTTMRVVFVFF